MTTFFPLFLLHNNNRERERKKRRENKSTLSYHKSCLKIIVKISFLFNLYTSSVYKSVIYTFNDVLPHQLMKHDESCVFNPLNNMTTYYWMYVFKTFLHQQCIQIKPNVLIGTTKLIYYVPSYLFIPYIKATSRLTIFFSPFC